MPRYRYTLALLFGVLCISATASASGAIYKWVDQNGVTQYSQTPPPKNAKSSQTVRVSTHVPVDVREGRAQGMVDAATLQAYTAPAQANGQPSSPASADQTVDVVTSPAPNAVAPIPTTAPASTQNGNASVNTPVPVPSAPVPLVNARPDQL